MGGKSAWGRLPSLGAGLLLLLASGAWAAESSPAAAAQHAYRQAHAQYEAQPHQTQAAWQFARACFDLAEFATNHSERAELAQQGIAAAQHALAADPKSAAAHYYLAMDMGQLARTKGLGALKLVREMETEFTEASELDPQFDYAGPDRNLGQLYRDAPSFGSIGSRSKARQHLQRAVQLAPDYPDNGLTLIESYLKWGDRNGALRELKNLEQRWPAARSKLTGPAWTASWGDWDQRLQDAKQKLEDRSKLESPRH